MMAPQRRKLGLFGLGLSPDSRIILAMLPPQIGFSLERLLLVEAFRSDDDRWGEGAPGVPPPAETSVVRQAD